jgi:hypothetical protein
MRLKAVESLQIFFADFELMDCKKAWMAAFAAMTGFCYGGLVATVWVV